MVQEHAHPSSPIAAVTVSHAPAALALSEAAVRALAHMPALQRLTLMLCGIRTLPQLQPLSALTQLTALSVQQNPIADVVLLADFVSAQMPQLRTLNDAPVPAAAQVGATASGHAPGPGLQSRADRTPMQAFLSHISHVKAQRHARLQDCLQRGTGELAGHASATPIRTQDAAVDAGCSTAVAHARRARRAMTDVVQECVAIHARWQELSQCWDSAVEDLCAEEGRRFIDD